MSTGKISTPIKGAIDEFNTASFLSATGLACCGVAQGRIPSSDLLVTTSEGHKTIS